MGSAKHCPEGQSLVGVSLRSVCFSTVLAEPRLQPGNNLRSGRQRTVKWTPPVSGHPARRAAAPSLSAAGAGSTNQARATASWRTGRTKTAATRASAAPPYQHEPPRGRGPGREDDPQDERRRHELRDDEVQEQRAQVVALLRALERLPAHGAGGSRPEPPDKRAACSASRAAKPQGATHERDQRRPIHAAKSTTVSAAPTPS